MSNGAAGTIPWHDAMRYMTEQLVQIRSVSPGGGETAVAREVLRLLYAGGLEQAYEASGLDPVETDAHGRHNAYAFLRGQSTRTIVLLGHIDTVDTGDYGALEPWACNPTALAAREHLLAEVTPGLADDLAAYPNDWMFGRGVADMKSGVAATIAVMRQFALQAAVALPPLSLILLATVDEENESAGVFQGLRLLLRLRERYGLDYLGAIVTDYTSACYPHDPHRYIYTGTVGKLLPTFVVVGSAAHAGAPFDGADANLLAAELIRELSMNDELCDVVRGQVTSPPVTLHAKDLKGHYDTQLPFVASFYLNVLTFTTSPGDLLRRLSDHARAALTRALQRIDDAQRRWELQRGHDRHGPPTGERTGVVLTYADLRAETVHRLGEQRVASALAEEWQRWPDGFDSRERCLQLTQRLWSLSGRQGPAVVIAYAPPYYPHVAATSCQLHRAVAEVVASHSEPHLTVREYFPLISDMSYLQLDADVDLSALHDNMPVWQSPTEPSQVGAYSLPLEAMRSLHLPVVNIGPYGRGVHQCDERVLMSYSFGVVPQLIMATIERLAAYPPESVA